MIASLHTSDWQFITCSCYHREKFLDSVRRRDLFLDILEQVRAKHGFVVAMAMPVQGMADTSELSALSIGKLRRRGKVMEDGRDRACTTTMPGEEVSKSGEMQRALELPGACLVEAVQSNRITTMKLIANTTPRVTCNESGTTANSREGREKE